MDYEERKEKLQKAPRVDQFLTSGDLPEVGRDFQHKNSRFAHTATHKIGDKYHHVFNRMSENDPQDYHFLSDHPDPSKHGNFLAEINTFPHNPEDMESHETKHFTNWHEPAQITYAKARTQGKGHGQQLYSSVLAHHGLLMSDDQISPGSEKQWVKNYPKLSGTQTELGAEDNTDRHVVSVKDKKAFHTHIGFQPDIDKPKKQPFSKSLSKLQKTRGSLTFPNLLSKDTRPETDVRTVDTNRQKEIAVKHNQQNYQNANNGETLPQMVTDTVRSHYKTLGDKLKSMGIDHELKRRGIPTIPGASLSEGSVVKFPNSKPIASVTSEGNYPQSSVRHHEGMHLMFDKIEANYGKQKRDEVENHAASLVHPDVKEKVGKYLSENGYNSGIHHKEFIPHMYEFLHDPEKRKILKGLTNSSDEDMKDIMGKMKLSYAKVRKYGQEVK